MKQFNVDTDAPTQDWGDNGKDVRDRRRKQKQVEKERNRRKEEDEDALAEEFLTSSPASR